MSDIKKDVSSLITIPYRLRNMVTGLIVDRISIDIDFDNYEKLSNKRKEAINLGRLLTSSDDYVSAKIRYKDKIVRVKLRLKGDDIDHLRSINGWSFRVKVRGDEDLFGMKKFSLQKPITRNYINEWIFHQALKRDDILSLRYFFVNVSVNGDNLGIYAVEEFFDKILIEKNKRREGPILKVSEDLMWQENVLSHKNMFIMNEDAYIRSNVDVFNYRTISNNPVLENQYIMARTLLEKYKRNELLVGDVFDLELLSKYLAISELFKAQHGNMWGNERFYFNPITAKLEPIGFDANAGTEEKSLTKWNYHLYDSAFDDYEFSKMYVKQLERISNKSYLDSLFNKIDEDLNRNLRILLSDRIFSFDKNMFYRQQEYIKSILNPAPCVRAYYNGIIGNGLNLELGNLHELPIKIIGIMLNDSTIIKQESDDLILDRKRLNEDIEYHSYSFTLPRGYKWFDDKINKVKVLYSVYGYDQQNQVKVHPWPFKNEMFVEKQIFMNPTELNKVEYLIIDEKNRNILFKSGKWLVQENLIIPKGYVLKAKEGVELILNNNANIVSFSPVEFIGTNEKPILIHSADSTGQGFTVINAGQPSVLKYVYFENLSSPKYNSWELTGSVNFYESDVTISNCLFRNNYSEDGLNLIRLKFQMNKTVFENSHSDAFDGDFVNGNIIHSSFVNCGNDCIDVSGSNITLTDVIIRSAGDKGISVGEMSLFNGDNITISKSEIGVTSKDLSKVILSNINIIDTKVGFTAFQKKPEFGPSEIIITNSTFNNVVEPYLIEKRSTMTNDGINIIQTHTKVEDMLYGIKYGKSSQ